jgi:hypothetical protein
MGCSGQNRLVVIFLIFTAMSRIHDLPSATPTTSDTIVGTDVSDSNKSVKFTIGDVIGLSVTSLTLNDLSNVNVPSPTTDYYLKFDGAQWVAAAVSGGGGATTLGGLTNVNASADSASNGQVISYDSGTSLYVPTTPAAVSGATTLAALTDTDTTGAVSGQYLKYNGSQWIDSTIVIEDISGFDQLGTPAASQVWVFNGTDQEFENRLLTLADLQDVANGTTGTVGDFLFNNGSTFVAQKFYVTTTLSPFGDSGSLTTVLGNGITAPSGTASKVLPSAGFAVPASINGWEIVGFQATVYRPNTNGGCTIGISNDGVLIGTGTGSEVVTITAASGSSGYITANGTFAASQTVATGDMIAVSILDSPAPVSTGDIQHLSVTVQFQRIV